LILPRALIYVHQIKLAKLKGLANQGIFYKGTRFFTNIEVRLIIWLVEIGVIWNGKGYSEAFSSELTVFSFSSYLGTLY
jgi:hypothetical protein